VKSFHHLPSIEAVIKELERLPGIGPKSATAMAYHLVMESPERLRKLVETISVLPEKVRECRLCGCLTETDPCRFCSEPGRDRSQICVVENFPDALSIERSGAFGGLYHVLGGVLSPLDGIGPAELRIRELLERLKNEEVEEVVIATNPSVEGEATAGYLKGILKDLGLGLRLTRFARGLPVGGDLLYADEETLAVAIQSRKMMEE
jgi:recombination protein RecR